jgi:hypothetical protein
MERSRVWPQVLELHRTGKARSWTLRILRDKAEHLEAKELTLVTPPNQLPDASSMEMRETATQAKKKFRHKRLIPMLYFASLEPPHKKPPPAAK